MAQPRRNSTAGVFRRGSAGSGDRVGAPRSLSAGVDRPQGQKGSEENPPTHVSAARRRRVSEEEYTILVSSVSLLFFFPAVLCASSIHFSEMALMNF